MSLSRRDFIRTGVGTACAVAASGAQAVQQSAGTKAPEPQRPALIDRMPEIPAEKMTEAQKKAVEQFSGGQPVPVSGPYIPLLRSPEVMLRTKEMGDYLRSNSPLPHKNSEIAILVTARYWSQQYIWDVHYPAAIRAGLSTDLINAIGQGRNPKGVYESEQLTYEFCTELLNNRCISDVTYAWARDKFGEQGVIDLLAVCGYYTFLSMIMNTARTALPKGANAALALFPD